MFDSFKQHENGFKQWIMEGYYGVKDETKEFIENLVRHDREKKLWRHQEESILRVIYCYEILGKKNTLLNIVTGGGKTVIIAAVMAWLKMAHNVNKFLVLTPNLIVKDRLEVDFRPEKLEDGAFRTFGLFPKRYERYINDLSCCVLESGTGPSGMLESGIILGNIQQFYSTNISGKRNIAYIHNFLGEIAVFNDEAHNTPAPEYTEVLSALSPKTIFRLDTTATPDRADGQTPDSEMIIHYDITKALEDHIVKSAVVYEPEIKLIELTYTNIETGQKTAVTELDEDFRKAELKIKPFQWILDDEPMKKQIAIALSRLDEQRRRAHDRYKPLLFVVTMSINEGKRARDMLQNVFKVNTLLVTEESDEKDREKARKIGSFESKYDAVVSVLMLREGWDVKEVSTILLLRKFSSPVYGQQVIGRGLRRIIRDEKEPEILAVVDHPRLQHDWLWRLVAVSKIRQGVSPGDIFADEDLPEKPKIQRLAKPENIIVIPSPEYETKIDFEKVRKEVPEDYVEKNWKQILNSAVYPKERIDITKIKVESIFKKYLDKTKRMEVINGSEITPEKTEEALTKISREELEEGFKQEVLSVASGLLMEAGFGGLKRGKLYGVILDHVSLKFFDGKPLSEVETSKIEVALAYMEEIRKNFTKPIIAGILKEVENAKK